MEFGVYFDNGNRSNGKFIKLKNGEFDVCVFQMKWGLVGVILGVSGKEMGTREKLRVRQQTGWLKKLCGSCCPLDGL